MLEQKRLTSSRRKGGARRFLAVAAALAVSLTGLVATPATTATAASSSSTGCSVNPMGAATPNGSENGYTVFARENAIFANSETEGTIAVGGTATFGDPRGNQNQQYPIMHGGVGGNADYSVPTIDGQPNRVLIQKFESNNKIVQVKAQGAVGSDAEAGAKIADQTAPAGYTFGQMFGGSGTTFFPADGNNMSPQIDSAVQPWTNLADAQSSWGTNGDVLSYFPADNGQTVLQSFSNWQPVEAPAGNDQTITLSADGPSKLPLSAFDGIGKYKLANYSETSFLVITVSAGDVVNGRVNLPSYSFAGKDSADKEGISHILFDLSALTGDIELTTANEPVRGSVYAPNAHVIFPAESDGGREFEGQIIAQSVTALQGGKEIHTNVFKGRFECSDQPSEPNEGTFNLRKILSGIEATNFPTGTTFPVTATWDGGTKTFDLPADGTVIPSGVTLPEGTTVTLTEGDLPTAPDGYTYVSNELSADTITIYQGDNNNIAWSVTNTYEKDVTTINEGTFNLRKILSGIEATNFPTGTTFPVTATWDGGTKTFDLPADGTVIPSGVTLPEGTTVTLTEGDLPTAPDGYTYVSNELSADTITIYQGDNNNIAWSVTNTYEKDVTTINEGTFNLRKILSGIEATNFPTGTTFPVTATWDGGTKTFDLPADGTVIPSGVTLPEGTTVTLTEGDLPTAPDGYTYVSNELSADTITIYQGDNNNIAWSVTNTYEKDVTTINEGTFNLRKILSGIEATNFPTGTTFPVTATWDGGTKTFDLPADGTVIPSGVTLPEGTTVTLTEGDLPTAPDGYTYVSNELSADTITIYQGDNNNIAWSVTNTYAVQEVTEGGFDLAKTLKGVTAADFADDTVFTVTATWTIDGTKNVREFKLPVDGSLVAGPRNLPAGTKVTFDEVDVPEIAGYSFTGVEFSAQTLTVQAGETAKVSAVNTYKETETVVDDSDDDDSKVDNSGDEVTNGPKDDELAKTGASTTTTIVLAGLLLLSAGGVLLITRRRLSQSGR